MPDRIVRLVRVPLVGAGTREDPFRANLPTYRLRTIDEKSGIAIVEIVSPEHLDPAQYGEFDRFNFTDVEPHE